MPAFGLESLSRQPANSICLDRVRLCHRTYRPIYLWQGGQPYVLAPGEREDCPDAALPVAEVVTLAGAEQLAAASVDFLGAEQEPSTLCAAGSTYPYELAERLKVPRCFRSRSYDHVAAVSGSFLRHFPIRSCDWYLLTAEVCAVCRDTDSRPTFRCCYRAL